MLRTLTRCLLRPISGPKAPHFPLRIARASYAKLTPEPDLNSNKVKLRNYQLECIKSVLHAMKRGHKRVGISLATGSGKTVNRPPLSEQCIS